MKLHLIIALCFVFLVVGCGSGVPSGSPDDSSDEALITSAMDYELKLIQKFFIPKLDKGIKDYLDFLEKTEGFYGGLTKVEISDNIEEIGKIQLALPEYKKSWKDAKYEILERSEASENDAKNYIEKKLGELYRSEMQAFDKEFKSLDKNENKDAETKLMAKVADAFVPKANAMLKELGFKEELFKKEDVTEKYYNPRLPNMPKFPYEVVSNFRNIKMHVKFPVMKSRNNEYITDFSTKTFTSLLVNVSDNWYLDELEFGQIMSRYMSGEISKIAGEAMFFFMSGYSFDNGKPEDAAISAGKLYFAKKYTSSDYNVDAKEEYFDIQNKLGEWVYKYDSSYIDQFMAENAFIKDNLGLLEDCEIEVKHTELKKINADLDISIKFKQVVENTDAKTKDADKDKKKDEAKKDEKTIVSEDGKFKIEDETIYLRVFLNNIGDQWRVIRTQEINEPRTAEKKDE